MDSITIKQVEEVRALAERMATLNIDNANCEHETDCKLADWTVLLCDALTRTEQERDAAVADRDDAGHSCEINQAAAHIAIKRLAKVRWDIGILQQHRPARTLEQIELGLVAEIYADLGGGPSPEALLTLQLPELETHRLKRELDAAVADAARHEAAVEKLAERLASRENGCDECYADPPGNPECCKQAAIAYAYAPATAQDAPHNNTAAKETPQCEHQEPDAQ